MSKRYTLLQVTSRPVKVIKHKLSDGSYVYDVTVDDKPGGWDNPNVVTFGCDSEAQAEAFAAGLRSLIYNHTMELA